MRNETTQRLSKKYPLTQEQIDFFKERQTKHENKVKANAKRLSLHFPNIANQLLAEVQEHDKSKWQTEEYFAYVWLTSVKNIGYQYPTSELEHYVDDKWTHHFQTNSHHPEYWIYKHNNITKMPDYELAHMVCDWAAMSQEFGNSLPKWWHHQKNAKKEFPFSETQQLTIENYISVFPELS